LQSAHSLAGARRAATGRLLEALIGTMSGGPVPSEGGSGWAQLEVRKSVARAQAAEAERDKLRTALSLAEALAEDAGAERDTAVKRLARERDGVDGLRKALEEMTARAERAEAAALLRDATHGTQASAAAAAAAAPAATGGGGGGGGGPPSGGPTADEVRRAKEAHDKEMKTIQLNCEEAQRQYKDAVAELEARDRLLASRSEEIKRLQNQVSTLQVQVADAARTPAANQIALLRNEADAAREAADQLRFELDTLRESWRAEARKAEDQTRANLEAMGSALSEAERNLAKMRAEKEEAQFQVRQLQGLMETRKTSAAFADSAAMTQALSRHLQDIQVQKNVWRKASEDLEVTRAELAAREGALELHKAAAASAETLAARVAALEEKERAWRKEERDLKCLLEIFQTQGTEMSDVDKLRVSERQARAEAEEAAAEAARLRAEVQALKQAAASTAASSATSATPAAASVDAGLVPSAVVKALESKCETLQMESSALQQELETLVSSFETLQAQAARMSASLAEKEYAVEVQTAEKAKATHIQNLMKEEKAALESRAMAAEAKASSHLQNAINAQKKARHLEETVVAKYLEEVRAAQRAFNEQRQAAMAHFTALSDALAKFEEMKTQHKRASEDLRSKTDEAADLVEKVSKLTQERDSLKRKLERTKKELELAAGDAAGKGAAADGKQANAGPDSGSKAAISGDVASLQNEVNTYRNMLRCSVCRVNPKQVVITKCFHTFCGSCIRRNLEIRHRKCPGCGIGFAESDVKEIFL
jgi:E3 ubiquitin-protein ligase BRE1